MLPNPALTPHWTIVSNMLKLILKPSLYFDHAINYVDSSINFCFSCLVLLTNKGLQLFCTLVLYTGSTNVCGVGFVTNKCCLKSKMNPKDKRNSFIKKVTLKNVLLVTHFVSHLLITSVAFHTWHIVKLLFDAPTFMSQVNPRWTQTAHQDVSWPTWMSECC